jgi:hypothetical protein
MAFMVPPKLFLVKEREAVGELPLGALPRVGGPPGIGEDPFDRRHLSPLRDEPLLQSLQVELEMPSDEFAIRGQDGPELVGRHALVPKHGLRPGTGYRIDLPPPIETHADHD